MKRTLLLILTLVVSAMSIEDIAEKMAIDLEMTRAEVQTCFDKTNVTLEDLMQVGKIMNDDLQTVDFDDSALRAGCFFKCLCHKKGAMTGARVNVDRIKGIIRSVLKKEARPTLEANLVAKLFQVLDTCVNRVNSITNECEVSLKYILCCGKEMKLINRSNNDDE
uniref:Pheromone binding protein 4 n=1 Tax=Odontomachus monticola TaxID=613454 RepID=A0A348G656_ODOMO